MHSILILLVLAGLFVLAIEPVVMPWFDAILADIGDEQSLSQSLSTFSGHLHRIKVTNLMMTFVCNNTFVQSTFFCGEYDAVSAVNVQIALVVFLWIQFCHSKRISLNYVWFLDSCTRGSICPPMVL